MIVRFICEQLERRLQLNAPGADYKLVFDDEFNETSLDTSKWSLYLPWTNTVSGDNRYHDTNGNYLSYMMPDDVSLPGDGTLHLTTEQRNETAPSGHVFNYTEGMITSSAHFTYAYGYAEVRAKLPSGPGNWDAFWMTNGWPPEDDIMEYWPGTTAGSSTTRSHQGLYGMDDTWHDYNATGTSVPSTNWHTFGFEWGPGYQKFYIDGQLRLSISGSFIPSTANPEYMLLNSGVQNGQTANYEVGNTAANTLQVDYVRVYGYTPNAGPAIANAGFDTSGSWTLSGAAAYNVGATLGQTGTGDLHIYGVGQASQTITGLLPSTTYTFSGYGEIGSGSAASLIGVENYSSGAGNVSSPIGDVNQSTPTWMQASQTFTTGPTDTSATLYLQNTVGNNMNLDDLSLTLTPGVAPSATMAIQPNATSNITLSTGSSGSFSTTTATSSNPSLVAASGLTTSGNTLHITPVSGQTGSTTITLNTTDMFGAYTTSFVVNVLPAIAISGDSGGTSQNDVFRVVRNGALLDVYQNNSTTPTEYTYANFSVMNITGLSGGDTLMLDYSAGDPVAPGGIDFDGGTGADSLSITGLSGNETATLQNGSLQIGSDFIDYANLENLSVDFGAGSNLLASSATSSSPVISLNVDQNSTLSLSPFTTSLPSSMIVNVSAASTLKLGGANVSIDQLSGAGSVINGGGTLTVGAAGGSSNFAGSISGTGGLTKIGAGTFILSGSNSFTGPVTIGTGATGGGEANGALRITSANALAGATSISLPDNNSAFAIFQLDGSGGSIALPASLAFTIDANHAAAGSLGATVLESLAGNNTIAGPITFTTGGNGYGIVVDTGSLTFTGAQAITHVIYLGGAGNGGFSGALSSSGALAVNGTGIWTLGASNSFTGGTSVSSGKLFVANADGLASGALALTGSSAASFAPNFTKAVKLSSLSMSANSSLDLSNNGMVVEGNEATIESLVKNGFAGNWQGAGIVSSVAVAGHTGVGVAGAGDLFTSFPATFLSQSVDANSVLLRYTLLGDSNLDGTVNVVDFNILAANFNSATTRWATGDSSYDGKANAQDFDAIATNYGATVPTNGSSRSQPLAVVAGNSNASSSLFSDQAVQDRDDATLADQVL